MKEYNTSRNLLHRNKLVGFVTWLEAKGWVEEKPKGDWEVHRFRHPSARRLAIIYNRSRGDHFTVHGTSANLVSQWLTERKEPSS